MEILVIIRQEAECEVSSCSKGDVFMRIAEPVVGSEQGHPAVLVLERSGTVTAYGDLVRHHPRMNRRSCRPMCGD